MPPAGADVKGQSHAQRLAGGGAEELDFQGQGNAGLLRNPLPDGASQGHEVGPARPRFGQEDVGVLLADYGSAEPHALAAAGVDEPSRRVAGGIAEDAACTAADRLPSCPAIFSGMSIGFCVTK